MLAMRKLVLAVLLFAGSARAQPAPDQPEQPEQPGDERPPDDPLDEQPDDRPTFDEPVDSELGPLLQIERLSA